MKEQREGRRKGGRKEKRMCLYDTESPAAPESEYLEWETEDQSKALYSAETEPRERR